MVLILTPARCGAHSWSRLLPLPDPRDFLLEESVLPEPCLAGNRFYHASSGSARQLDAYLTSRSQNRARSVYTGVESVDRESDAELLAAARSDPQAFGRFYDRYEGAVVGYFTRRTRVPEVAADLIAEVFARALAGAGRYRPDAPTAAVWLFAIARNTLAGSVRRGQVEARARRRIGVATIELQEDSLARLTTADGERWVRELLDSLPADQREAIRARVLDERGYADIARELRTSELVVRKRVSRGLARLRQRMEGPR